MTCHDCKTGVEGQKHHTYTNKRGRVWRKCAPCYEKEPRLSDLQPVECYTRIVGYLRPRDHANPGKRAEIEQRKMFEFKKT